MAGGEGAGAGAGGLACGPFGLIRLVPGEPGAWPTGTAASLPGGTSDCATAAPLAAAKMNDAAAPRRKRRPSEPPLIIGMDGFSNGIEAISSLSMGLSRLVLRARR